MHFFRNRNRPRSSFDIKVGKCHILEVTVHLRRRQRRTTKKRKKNVVVDDDWDWYNTNKDEINDEFLELLERSIISRMFSIEIEEYYQKYYPSIVLPPKNYDIDSIGSKNKVTTTTTTKNKNKKRKGGGGGATVAKKNNNSNKKKQKKNYASFGKNNNNDDDDDGQNKNKPEKDIYFAFGELIELAYKKETINDDNKSRTILFTNQNNSNETNKEETATTTEKTAASKTTTTKTAAKTTTRFHDRHKISSRLLVWISPIHTTTTTKDNNNADTATALASTTKVDTIYEYRNEMIPISNLFRKPPEVIMSSDDDDDDDDGDGDDDDDEK